MDIDTIDRQVREHQAFLDEHGGDLLRMKDGSVERQLDEHSETLEAHKTILQAVLDQCAEVVRKCEAFIGAHRDNLEWLGRHKAEMTASQTRPAETTERVSEANSASPVVVHRESDTHSETETVTKTSSEEAPAERTNFPAPGSPETGDRPEGEEPEEESSERGPDQLPPNSDQHS